MSKNEENFAFYCCFTRGFIFIEFLYVINK